MIIKWKKKKDGSITDISNVVGTVSWEGSTTQAARTATITVLNAPNDPNIQKLKLNLAVGDIIALYEDGKNIFYGEIQTSEKTSEKGQISYTANDLMSHMLRISHKGKFKNKTPEAIAKELCKKYGISTTSIAKTKKSIGKLIIDENNLYNIVMMAYTKAAKSNGKKYMAFMESSKFGVKERGKLVENFTISDQTNITNSTYEESIENLVDQVRIYNEKGKQVGVVKNADHIKRYGVFQEIYTKEKGVNAKTAAKNMLVGIEKKVNVEVINANINCVAGAAVKVHDAATNLDAKFWIDSDSHTWENGQHKMSLELNFKNIMDSQESDDNGTKKTKKGSGTNKSLAGNYIVKSTSTVMREKAGRSSKMVEKLKKGEKVKCTGKYTYVGGTAWYQATAKGKTGYIYSPNLKKG